MKDEISEKLRHDKKGIVAMATAEKDMVGSQFYITMTSRLPRLDGKYTIIGEVVEGLETLEKINEAVVDVSGRPIQVLRIQHTIVIDDPFHDPIGLKIPDRSPSPPRNWPSGMLPEDLDDLNEDDDSRRAHLAEQAAKAKAEALVLIGELPDADVKPPDNILFVCKLNPTTVGRSLAVIFSRFGKVLSSDVIHDRHGNSLCYAFVEFDERSHCEEAYLKMQNVLIDGRRIHVDFCQSVSKTENFRAAGGWKSFFADRAVGFNNQEGGGQRMGSGGGASSSYASIGGGAGGAGVRTGLEFKRSGQAPLSFQYQQPRHNREYDRGGRDGSRETSSHYEPRRGRGGDGGSFASKDRQDQSSYYRQDRDIDRDNRRYEDRDHDRRGYGSSEGRKRPGSPIRDEDVSSSSYKRPKYSESRR
jgi:peptidyl-prolyl cis-trans isomerase-like 4